MTAGRTAGAAARDLEHWHAIDWPPCHQNVRRLQGRSVPACQAGRWGKGQALQRLLPHSLRGRAIAVKRVTENPGKRTPGMDGTLWNTPEKQAQAIPTLRHRGYRPTPRRRVYLPKSHGKKRPLGILTMHDRAMQVLDRLAVDPIAAETADPNSLCSWNARRELYQKVGNFVGSVISPVLATLTLDGLEQKLREQYPTATAQSRRAKVNLMRWADDFLITGSSKELREPAVKPLVETFLKARGLERSPETTSITQVEAGVDLRGPHGRTYQDGTIILTPSAKNGKPFRGTVRQVIKGPAQATAGTRMRRLKPVIRGWAHSHRHVRSQQTLVTLDHALFQALGRWARRRHPKKPQRWRKEKYLHHIEQRHWVVCGATEGRQGQPRQVRLWRAAQVKIKRHSKMHGEAHPYAPAWEQYFEQRLGLPMASELQGRRPLLHLWRAQPGLCPVCDQTMTTLTGWHRHHRVRRVDGGSEGRAHRVLRHPHCHSQVHTQE
ncbi:MAG TPA: reverse transcriptase N-terminal domain-containing protein [Candidatus Saccharimonadia bacterium]|nr:reverse transcriptase N-terminal domain-containing protein [Candidatus Saccharimonadia bacterium]